jgi:hypothetical protein
MVELGGCEREAGDEHGGEKGGLEVVTMRVVGGWFRRRWGREGV